MSVSFNHEKNVACIYSNIALIKYVSKLLGEM